MEIYLCDSCGHRDVRNVGEEGKRELVCFLFEIQDTFLRNLDQVITDVFNQIDIAYFTLNISSVNKLLIRYNKYLNLFQDVKVNFFYMKTLFVNESKILQSF